MFNNKLYMVDRYAKRRALAVSLLGNECGICQKADGPLNLCKRIPTGRPFARVFSMTEEKLHRIVLDEFVLRCEEHRLRGTAKEAGHGTYARYYRYGCRCDECEEWQADYLLRRKEDRRQKLKEQAQ